MKKRVNLSHIGAGFTAVIIGYASAAIIVIQAASALGASESQIESWLFTLGIVMGLTTLGLSWWFKMPILTAWSTPSAALLVGVGQVYDMPTAIAAFMIASVATIITGLIRPVCRAIETIPGALGSAMLAAILLPFCLGAFNVANSQPIYFAVMFLCLVGCKLVAPKITMYVLLTVGIVLAFIVGAFNDVHLNAELASAQFTEPSFNLAVAINLAIPLYLVTMLSQNLPGLTLLHTHNYKAPIKPILVTTGVVNFLSAPFGGFSLNLAAISAAVCMNDEVDSAPEQRYKATLCAGFAYLGAGLFSSVVVSLLLALPKEIASLLAGFALLGTLLLCLHNAFANATSREAALLTFLIALSGVSLFGVNAILLGLLVGLAYLKGQQFVKRAN